MKPPFFLPRNKSLLISWLQSPSAVILEPPKIKSVTFHCFPIYLPWSDGTRCHDLSFLNVEFYDQPRQHIKKQRHYFANKGPFSQSCGFPSSHVWMWELDYKESWVPKNWYFWTVVLEKTLESPLDSKEIQPVHPKGNQSWIFIGRTVAEAETPILWPPDVKNDSLGKTLMLGKIEGRRRRGWQRMRWLDSITNSMDWVWVSSRSWWGTGRPGVLQSIGSQGVGHDWVTELTHSLTSFFSALINIL